MAMMIHTTKIETLKWILIDMSNLKVFPNLFC
jgi:hypothetical protein